MKYTPDTITVTVMYDSDRFTVIRNDFMRPHGSVMLLVPDVGYEIVDKVLGTRAFVSGELARVFLSRTQVWAEEAPSFMEVELYIDACTWLAQQPDRTYH